MLDRLITLPEKVLMVLIWGVVLVAQPGEEAVEVYQMRKRVHKGFYQTFEKVTVALLVTVQWMVGFWNQRHWILKSDEKMMRCGSEGKVGLYLILYYSGSAARNSLCFLDMCSFARLADMNSFFPLSEESEVSADSLLS
jgi:hypothetical protein